MTSAGAEILRVEGLSKSFAGFPALDRARFAVRGGEILGVIGPNGAGKTTLLECIAGLLAADSGTVADDNGPLPCEARKELLFYVPDGVRPYADHRVDETLSFFASIYGRGSRDLHHLTARLELSSALHKRIGALSKGTLKRLLLAVGLLTPQRLLILDEPFDGLDLRQTRAAMDLLREIRAGGRTLLLSIHQLIDAERICDRFALLRAGVVVGTGTLEELRVQAGKASGGLEEVFLALA